MRILVTGREGQVARSLAARGARHELIFAGRPELDLAEPASIEPLVTAVAPDLIVSAAAYTAVDKAEDEPEAAMAVNCDGPAALARAAARIGAPIVHLSTDYVFDGGLDRPWREDDPVAPLGVYGETKLAGERAVAASGAHYAILRTAWVYSPFGNNFVKTMLRLAESRPEINVVADQIGCPTSAFDIAEAVLAIADAWQGDRSAGAGEIHHFAGPESVSWADFARAIFAGSAALAGPCTAVHDIPTSAYPTRARRPANSRLNSTKFAARFGYRARPLSVALDEVLRRLISDACCDRAPTAGAD